MENIEAPKEGFLKKLKKLDYKNLKRKLSQAYFTRVDL